MFKKIGYALVALAAISSLLLPQTARAGSPERRIVYVNGLDGHAVSVNADGSDRRDYGQGYFPKMSPDGSKIAFARDGADYTTRDLYIVNADGSDLRKLVERVYTIGSPALQFSWSPDGTKIAFTAESGAADPATGGEFKQIATVNIANGMVTALTNEPAGVANYNPAWSPDGSKILYSRAGLQADLYSMNTDGSNQHQIVADATNGSWSPDAAKILFNKGDAVFVAASDGANQVQLAAAGANAAWSPNGARIVMQSAECNCSGGAQAIVLVDPDGGNRTVLANPPTAGGVGQPAWSPDSSQVIFAEFARWEPARLVKAAVVGGNRSVVVTESAGYPQWAYLAYVPPAQQHQWQFNFNLQAELQAYLSFSSRFTWR